MSDRQRTANKQNATRSTGPITEAGKAASSRNSFRHGLTAVAVTMLPDENIEDFLAFGNGLRAEHNPATVTEDALVSRMIQSLWFSARAVRQQERVIHESADGAPFDRIQYALFLRYQSLHDRAFSRALADLVRLRKEADRLQNGFVQQERQRELHETKIRSVNKRIEVAEIAVQYGKVRNARFFAAAPAQIVPAGPVTVPF